MPKFTAPVAISTVKSGFSKWLTDQITDLNDGTPIEAALTADQQHDYWVILEYGSSPANQTGTLNRGATSIELNIPDHIPEPKHHTEWYVIKARRGGRLAFIDRKGRFRDDKWVEHPGIKARGFIRRSIWDVEKELSRTLKALGKDETMPDIDELVIMVNTYMRAIRTRVANATPDRDPRDVYDGDGESHLKNVWKVKLAKMPRARDRKY